MAMAICLGVVAMAGVFLAIRSNFDPFMGPGRLIFGFEAVIIGGLGNLWGTLVGGIILGVAQGIGAEINPGWQILAGHLAFIVVLAIRPKGLFPRVDGCHLSPAHNASRIALCRRCRWSADPAPGGGHPHPAPARRIRRLSGAGLALEPARGYTGLSQSASSHVGLGGYVLFAPRVLGSPLVAIPVAGGSAPWSPPVAAFGSACMALFRHGTWVVAEVFR